MSNLALFIVPILAVSTATGLQCYSCNSKSNIACKWGLTSILSPTETCASAGWLDKLVGPKCYRLMAKDNSGSEYVERGCLNPPAVGCTAMAEALSLLLEDTIQCSTCDSDLCNLFISKTAAFTIIVLLLFLFKKIW